MKRVLAFGAFDPLHKGHEDFFRQARALGDWLTIIVARDANIKRFKKRDPHQAEAERLAAVAAAPNVDEALLGQPGDDQFRVLGLLEFDIVALGYDQKPDKELLQQELIKRGRSSVNIVRLKPYQAEIYKSSYLRIGQYSN